MGYTLVIIKIRAQSDRCKFILVLENHICLSANVNPQAVKLFLVCYHFLPNFAQIDQTFFSHFLTKYGHLIHYYISNFMLNLNLFTEFSLLFKGYFPPKIDIKTRICGVPYINQNFTLISNLHTVFYLVLINNFFIFRNFHNIYSPRKTYFIFK